MLSYRYFGPFQILERVGQVSYRLDLPDDCRLHQVVHVSQLKAHISPQIVVDTDISAIPMEAEWLVQPVEFLRSRVNQKGAGSIC